MHIYTYTYTLLLHHHYFATSPSHRQYIRPIVDRWCNRLADFRLGEANKDHQGCVRFAIQKCGWQTIQITSINHCTYYFDSPANQPLWFSGILALMVLEGPGFNSQGRHKLIDKGFITVVLADLC
jgi:hypothetical protein